MLKGQMVMIMYEEMFSARLAKLRNLKGVSARDMSLSIGQNPGYINNIETGKAFPSMTAFFFICEYLGITPQEFFDTETEFPEEIRSITNNLKKLSSDQISNVAALVNDLATK
jgi:transcriptional regulator with XRE-family HTH domain